MQVCFFCILKCKALRGIEFIKLGISVLQKRCRLKIFGNPNVFVASKSFRLSVLNIEAH